MATPWKTLAKVSSNTFVAGDTINLKSGETWNESVQLSGQGTSLAPITLSSYGTGNKPLIRSNAGTVVGGTNLGGWIIDGLAIECTSTDEINVGVQNTGIQFTYDGTGSYSNINITNNEISGTAGAGYDKNTQGVRILTLSENDNQSRVLTNININNNLIYNVGWLGIATTAWKTTAVRDNLSTQLYGNVNVLGNTVHTTGAQGITIHSVQVGAMTNNLVYDCGQYNGTNISWGTSGIWCMLSSNMDITYNEVYGQKEADNTNYDASGFDIDWTCENIDLQYNYAHDNDGPGIETMANKNCTIMYNKVSGNKCSSNVGKGQITLSSYTVNPEAMTGLTNLMVSHNLIIVNQPNTVALGSADYIDGTWSGNTFTDNHIVMTGGVSGTKAYDLVAGANLATVNNNTIYSVSGTDFVGKKNGMTYNSLAAWRAATGFDLNSITALLSLAPTEVPG